MKRIFAILICLLSIHLYAVDYAPLYATTTVPVAQMQSVNSASYMSSGSNYSSGIYEVDASAPSSAGRSIRKAPPGKDDGSHDPTNPQFSPIGDAVLPLLALALLYTACLFRRLRRRQDARITQAE